ncbi:MAG: group 1 truncated hemoglobin [Actinomycetota bacterium]|nr:group 1 truncated hemoglobin [Actinomycetota bacterium]
MSLYDQLGQEVGIGAAVDEFYVRVLADPELAPYFTGVDMDKVRQHQVQLLGSVSGGPQQYSGRTLDLAHRRLGVTGPHFDRVVAHLGSTLDDMGVAPDVRDQVAAVLDAQRDAVVSEPARTA